jgi:hypothetical protein
LLIISSYMHSCEQLATEIKNMAAVATTYSILPISVHARTASARDRAASTCTRTHGHRYDEALWR